MKNKNWLLGLVSGKIYITEKEAMELRKKLEKEPRYVYFRGKRLYLSDFCWMAEAQLHDDNNPGDWDN